jgi:hypothetical protein
LGFNFLCFHWLSCFSIPWFQLPQVSPHFSLSLHFTPGQICSTRVPRFLQQIDFFIPLSWFIKIPCMTICLIQRNYSSGISTARPVTHPHMRQETGFGYCKETSQLPVPQESWISNSLVLSRLTYQWGTTSFA